MNRQKDERLCGDIRKGKEGRIEPGRGTETDQGDETQLSSIIAGGIYVMTSIHDGAKPSAVFMMVSLVAVRVHCPSSLIRPLGGPSGCRSADNRVMFSVHCQSASTNQSMFIPRTIKPVSKQVLFS
jgi:hypothetical protein